jgi:hypothetical protein
LRAGIDLPHQVAARECRSFGLGAGYISVAVKDFTVENAHRRERAPSRRDRGIPTDDRAMPRTVRIADPDRIPIGLSAANSSL